MKDVGDSEELDADLYPKRYGETRGSLIYALKK